MKRMLSVDEQIEHMKQKGITFRHTTEDEAKTFLACNNYYMKLAAYRANYPVCETGKRAGQYNDLDFAYLRELSTLDMHLRYLVIEMCLDIEHAIKVRLVASITQNPEEDGYSLVRQFLKNEDNFRTLRELQQRRNGEYCRDLYEKYYPYFPAWVFVELVSFGTLLHFADFCNRMHQNALVDNALMNTVRDLRNAAAHSNCLMNQICTRREATKQPHAELVQFVRSAGVSKSSCTNNLNFKFAHDITALLYVYDRLVADVPKSKRFAQLQEFMDNRVVRNRNFFSSNTKITGTYRFLKKVVDNLAV